MYSKIALGNVKKSFKDYTIYFLTLTLAVCIFYSFNSIESQKIFTEMKASQKEYMSIVLNLISYVSVFVSFVLGGLILYANNFLVKKRKKELGIYMLLGMGKGKISRILVFETFIVGVVSLLVGLALGLIASQGLSVFTSTLFEVSMSEYDFVISPAACGKTIVYFGIIFILVMLFNTGIVSRYKIIDLLTAGRKNEKTKIKNPLFYLVTFILCVISLGLSYAFVLDVGIDLVNPKFKMSIGLGIIGTILFFFSLAGFLLFVVKKNDNVYLKGLNIFVTKQLNSKVNTNYLSMSVICLMLLFTIGGLSTGISLKNALESNLKNTTPFDASATMYVYPEDKLKQIEESLKNAGFSFGKEEKYAYYNVYDFGVPITEFLSLSEMDVKAKKALSKYKFVKVEAIKESEYNQIRKFKGKQPIQLNDNEVVMLSNMNQIVPIVNEYLDKTNKVNIKGKEFIVKNSKADEEVLKTDSFADVFVTLVVKDDVTKNLPISTSNVNVNYTGTDKEQFEKRFADLNKYYYGEVDYKKVGFVNVKTREMLYGESKGMTTAILFVVVYLGIVFLITSMAVLALQQLSEASESVERYKVLKKIGANEKMINKTIFTQTLVYFSLPVLLAFIHSVVGITVVNEFIATFNQPDIGTSSLITAGIFLVVYSGYFYATYVGYKNIIKSNV